MMVMVMLMSRRGRLSVKENPPTPARGSDMMVLDGPRFCRVRISWWGRPLVGVGHSSLIRLGSQLLSLGSQLFSRDLSCFPEVLRCFTQVLECFTPENLRN